jgi:hypothetical protein
LCKWEGRQNKVVDVVRVSPKRKHNSGGEGVLEPSSSYRLPEELAQRLRQKARAGLEQMEQVQWDYVITLWNRPIRVTLPSLQWDRAVEGHFGFSHPSGAL